MEKQLTKAYWEKCLSKHGLSTRQLDDVGKLTLPIPTSEIVGIQHHQFDSEMSPQGWRAGATGHMDFADLERFHEVPMQIYHRDIPAWSVSNLSLQKVIRSLYPHVDTNARQRECAGRACLLLYRYFRLCEPASSIADDLDVPIRVVHRRIERLKARAIALRLA